MIEVETKFWGSIEITLRLSDLLGWLWLFFSILARLPLLLDFSLFRHYCLEYNWSGNEVLRINWNHTPTFRFAGFTLTFFFHSRPSFFANWPFSFQTSLFRIWLKWKQSFEDQFKSHCSFQICWVDFDFFFPFSPVFLCFLTFPFSDITV